MRSNFSIRWAVVCAIWVAILVVTFWNGVRIDAVAQARERNERMRQEILFLRQNARSLAQIHAAHERLFLTAESIDLAVVVARSRLGALAAAFGLKDAIMQADAGEAMDDRVPLRLTLRGPLGNAVEFLSALRNHPYVALRRAGLKSVEGEAAIEIQIDFDLRCRIAAPEADAHDIPEVDMHRALPESKTL
jgi:hypothetical protein